MENSMKTIKVLVIVAVVGFIAFAGAMVYTFSEVIKALQ